MAARASCAVESALKQVGDRWTLAIVHELSLGPRRTVELHRGFTGLSTKTLLGRLKKLEHAGLVSRRSFNESPPRVEYSLTAAGRILLPLVKEMAKWAGLWDEQLPHGPECTACAFLKEGRETGSEDGAAAPETIGATPGHPRATEPLPSRRSIRKRKDVTLL